MKGKRNKHCEFEVLEEAILRTYVDQKKAQKVLGKLRIWWFEVEKPKMEREEREAAMLGMGKGVSKAEGKRVRRMY
jgi:hypothetical protein